MWSALALEITALVILMVDSLRARGTLLLMACTFTVVGVWIEKGIGLIIPGFVPTPIGEFLEYVPTATELFVSIAIWAFGIFLFTVLIRPILAIESGEISALGRASNDSTASPSSSS
jgi:molybdopterin-containing oxidoreductase family membrane subunit